MIRTRHRLSAWPFALALTACAGPSPPADPADLVLVGGRVVPVQPGEPEATALAIRDGRIVAVGDDAAVAAQAGPDTRRIDVGGRLVLPGFIESHGHFLGLGARTARVDLRGAATWDEVVEQVRAAADAVPAGSWIRGRGWHQETWKRPPDDAVQGFPTRAALDRAVPDHPVALVHASGHAVVVNGAGLAAAGIGRDTPDPPGGRIVRDRDGRPTGLLHETAADLVDAAIARAGAAAGPDAVRAETERLARSAGAACAAHGVTSFQDAGTTLAELEVYDDLTAAGDFPVRLWVMLGEPDAAIADRLDDVRTVGAHDGFLTVRAIKRYADGALGNRGAWLLEPYADEPGTTGIPVASPESLADSAALARDHHYQLCVHAIGDRANREVLDVYAGSVDDGSLPARRWRVEHAQHVHPDDIPRFGELGVIASVQAVHCASDGPWVARRIGEARAASGAYAWRSLLDSGAVVANGTDVPVEPIDPIAGFHALVTREMADGRAFHPEQAMTRTEALRAMTLDAAYAAFEDDVKGSLVPGKYADVVVLTEDILAVPEDRIRDAEIWMTLVGGRIVHRAPLDEESAP